MINIYDKNQEKKSAGPYLTYGAETRPDTSKTREMMEAIEMRTFKTNQEEGVGRPYQKPRH
jgi:hypothetical protein